MKFDTFSAGEIIVIDAEVEEILEEKGKRGDNDNTLNSHYMEQ